MEAGHHRRAHHWTRWSSERGQAKSGQVNLREAGAAFVSSGVVQ